ncbi:MAG: tetratricopeptide repeat protein [Vampirovibrionales bacterium]|jgi:tetratricopeptide (TPR) repeat protein|nr:tetratricopeptide repeat protein [Vampirovibrionales bacterium]
MTTSASMKESALLHWDALLPARQALFIQKDAQQALELLPINPFLVDVSHQSIPIQNALIDLTSQAYLETGQLKEATLLWKRYGRFEQASLGFICMRQYPLAREMLDGLTPKHQAYWAEVVFRTCTNQLDVWPSFLHLRNRLEGDLLMMFRFKALDCLEHMMGYLNSFSLLNPEVFKLVGRVFTYSGLLQQAYLLLQRSLEKNPLDPENYFHLAQLYLQMQQRQKAKLMLRQAIAINADYTPVRDLLASIK